MFDLELRNINNKNNGKITIDDFSELLSCPIGYWNENDYIQHWKKSLSRLFNGYNKSVLFTTMHDPETSNFYDMWCFHLKKDVVYITNEIFFLDTIDDDFNIDDYYKYIDDIDECDDDCSIWITDKNNILKYINS
ncbi:hypothetical protein CTM97_21490 [Photobacterium phosphoreum]|uniref:CdiI C-terminal domain-containing protein n=1 Tax=Photobacterium phosphoreum TaxID=659 RepID=A0A2T3JP34_PHOPO|nr:hypothetical protein [Photobacterium phosphoreum]PSU26396.1 hypothetical protein CTM96_05125 [Photobacterium phosphoreum]PSU36570.1 hypothetical protein CTM97_21490 [Photobacterium phosphoreum]PSU50785.1 hypothetical protein C9J18_14145 [Photobacterium phosphoreum]